MTLLLTSGLRRC